jgi:hypothetical protein
MIIGLGTQDFEDTNRAGRNIGWKYAKRGSCGVSFNSMEKRRSKWEARNKNYPRKWEETIRLRLLCTNLGGRLNTQGNMMDKEVDLVKKRNLKVKNGIHIVLSSSFYFCCYKCRH